MGKYIKTKPKPSTELSSSVNGVLTRAKTLALKKSTMAGVGSYIQLRSRRLVKVKLVNRSTLKDDCGVVVKNLVDDKKDEFFQENVGLGVEGSGRTTRETTPCNLIRDPDDINIPSSSTKSTRPTGTKHRVQNATPRHIPSTSEMDKLFTGPEKQQQQLFIEKYNFDPVNDKPLPGRYEWRILDATKKS